MSQILVNNQGHETGVFLSKSDWNLVKTEMNNWDKKLSKFDKLILPNEELNLIEVLKKAQDEPLTNSVNAKLFLKNLKNKQAI